MDSVESDWQWRPRTGIEFMQLSTRKKAAFIHRMMQARRGPEVSNDQRIWGRGWYFNKVTADPKNPDTVYVQNTSIYRSTDGGVKWTAIKGAPGGRRLSPNVDQPE
jgi:hypothetical protein